MFPEIISPQIAALILQATLDTLQMVAVAAGLGTVLGLLALWLRNDAIHLFTRLTQSQAALERFYMFTEVPAHLSPKDLVVIVASSIAIALGAAVLPAWRAARLKPAEALRSE